MSIKIEKSWKEKLDHEFEKDYFKSLIEFVKLEYKTGTVYPPGNKIFNAFEHCTFDNTKVVIIGQDPYHGPNQANGLSFSVNNGISLPPSLKNIYKELKDDLGIPIPSSGNLEKWAEQGVLLLNSILTVRANTPGAHQGKGWEKFTDEVIKVVSDFKENIVFILWGAYAQKKGAIINLKDHLILKAAHPSPFSAHNGFFGCKHFSKTNNFLLEKNITPINW